MNIIDVITIGLQIILPIILISWLAFAPLGSRLGFALQTIATGLVLIFLLLAGLWMVPPWWVPYLYILSWVIVIIWRGTGLTRNTDWRPKSLNGWAGSILFLAICIFSVLPVFQAIEGRQLPDEYAAIDIAFPMGPGTYLVVNGGSNITLNAHLFTIDPQTERQAAYRGQSYGVDIIKLNDWGFRASGWRPSDPSGYAIFGRTIYAPCAGKVVDTLNNKPDMVVPTADTSQLEGNHVLIECEDYEVLLAHLKQKSVKVSVGDHVITGQPVGDAGNSGNTNEPHLHVHVQRRSASGAPLSGDPLFLTFNGKFPVRNDRLVIGDLPTE